MVGISLALASTALFTLVGVLVRVLSDSVSPFQILFFRQLVFVAILLPAMLKLGKQLFNPFSVRLHLLRICGAFFALYLGFIAYANLPFATATALGFTQVLFVLFISKLFLSEDITASRVITIAVGFVGVIMVVQPENASLNYVLVGLTAALGAAVAVVCVRKMAAYESRTVLLSYQALFVGIIALVPCLFDWYWPTPREFGLLVCVGVISSVAQFIGVTAYKWAEANIVANVEYAKIIYSLIIGYLLFAEVPNSLAIVGAVFILMSAVIPFIKLRKE
ncbi:DMT family transporter [Vibrio ishigakensis]|uniref:DMT family transporter n=1 Tax=Vibrio ishigakensis TaxID=1481914 RepID=UPI0021C389B7|nr:DMT family transporter [Vibrio ishigakensis]